MTVSSILSTSLKRIERLITRPAELVEDPAEREAEFQRRLERTRRLLAELGHPDDSFDIIHIGGTSGKGSIAMFCESLLRALGGRVGTHTSPYLQTPLEKVRIDGRLVAESEAAVLVDRVLAAVDAVQAAEPELGNPHYAEAWLGMALRAFADEQCNMGVVEVGMGGRYDATNIVLPRVSVISTIHYDHTRVLGETLAEIAFHKAGIIKAGVPVIVGEVGEVPMKVIADEAALRGSRMVRLGREVRYAPIELSPDGGRFRYDGLDLHLDDVRVGLLGAHQFANATAALAAVEVYAATTGMALDEAAIRRGLQTTRFAGRLEVMQTDPMVVLDGAHNQEKIGSLIAALREVFHYRRLILVLGMLEAKAVEPILKSLSEVADVMITTYPRVKGKPAIPADELAALAREAGAREAIAEEQPLAALDRALAMAEKDDLVVVSGSLYLIGQVRSHWHTAEEIVAQRTMFPNGYPH